MQHRNTLNINDWMRRRQALFGVLLALTVLFNAANAFALADSSVTPMTHTALAGHDHDMQSQSSCCTSQSQEHNHCCQGKLCDCATHCASLLLSRQIPLLPNQFKQSPPQLAEYMPLPHVDPPPQRPPRS